MSPEPARDRLRRVADRLPDGLRRRAEVAARRLRSGGPEVSVVVLLHGHEAHARAALDAVRDQPLPRLEIVAVVMQDHLEDLAQSAAEEDWRVRPVDMFGDDWAAGRRFGAVAAKADWLLFVSPREVLVPGALEAMLAERTADHVVLGGLVDQDADSWARTPLLGRLLVPRARWARAIDDSERNGQSVAVTLLVQGHHDLGRATLRDELQRTRLFEKAENPMSQLSARVAADRSSLVVLERPDYAVEHRVRAAGALSRDLPTFLRAVELCDDPGWALLQGHAAELVDLAGDELAGVPVEDRVMAWLAAGDRRAELTDFVAGRRFADGQVPTEVVDGEVLARFDRVPDDLPDHVARLTEAETPLCARLRRSRVEDDYLLLELYAGLRLVDAQAPEVTARLVGPTGLTLAVTQDEDAAVTRWMGDAHQRHDLGLIRTEVSLGDLTHGEWRLELTLTDRGVRRSAVLDDLDPHGSAARPLVADGRSFTWQQGAAGLVLVVADAPDDSELRPTGIVVRRVELAQGEVALTLEGAPTDADVALLGPGHTVLGRREDDDRWVLELVTDPWGLGPAPAPTGTYRLSVRAAETELLVAISDEVADDLPRTELDALRRTSLWRGPRGGLLVRLDPDLGDDEAGRFAQARLQEGYREISDRVDPHLVYFQSFLGQAPTDHPAAISAELLRRRPDGVRLVWAVADASVRVPDGCESVLLRSTEWYDVLARAAYVVTNIELDPWFERREGQEVLATYHGYPAKAMGLGQWRNRGLTPTHLDQMLARTSGTWNNLLTPIPEMDRYYRENYAFEGRIIAEGYPRDDALLADDREEQRASTRRRLGIADHQRVVLYAPTWRDDLATDFRRAQAVLHLDVEETAHALGPDYVVLLRGHRFHAVGRGGGAHVVDVTAYPEVNDLILAADVAVLDYSSMRFDVALAGKPAVFLVPDLDDYAEQTRGFLFDFARSAPGLLVDTTEQVVAALADLPALAERWAPRIAEFNAYFHRLDDGHAAERVVDEFFGPLLEG